MRALLKKAPALWWIPRVELSSSRLLFNPSLSIGPKAPLDGIEGGSPVHTFNPGSTHP